MTNPSTDAAQVQFDSKYITSTEVMRDLELSRTGMLYYRESGKLPHAIDVGNGRIFIWEREFIVPIVKRLKENRKTLAEA